MKYLVTSEEMKEYDNNTIERIGIPAMVLMERAALALRDEIMALCTKALKLYHKATVLIAVGRGNNGADGLALARLLEAEGFAVSVFECGDTSRATEMYQLQRAALTCYQVDFLEDVKRLQESYDFIVDGIFGIGLTRKVSGIYKDAIDQLNRIQGIKIAIDIPSGIDGTSGTVMGCSFKADVTVSFGFGKRGLYLYPGAEYAGRVRVARMGIDEHSFYGHLPETFTYDETVEELLPVRRKDGNKGTFGKVLLVAGWEYMAGAAIMSAKATLGMGAGMVKVFCSESNRSIVQCAVPEAMYGDAFSLTEDIMWADVVVAGPGIGQSQEALEALETILTKTQKTNKKVLLDADALNLVSKHEKLKKYLAKKDDEESRVVMTPHIGELSRLTGKDISYIKSNIVEVAKEASLDYDSIMVCKDARTYVHETGKTGYLNLNGNSGMATAGSGDVLTGMIAGLLAQGQDAFSAACTGVYLHGLAGDRAALQDTEYGVTATRIISRIEDIMKGC